VSVLAKEQIKAGWGRHAPKHGRDALAVPAVPLRVRPAREAGEVERVRVARRVARDGDALRRALVRDELQEDAPGALLDLQRRLGEGHRETGLQVPLDVAWRQSGRNVSIRAATGFLRGGKRGVQWKSQVPGLSAITRRVTECIEGTWTVSRRIGFFWPSTMGGLRVGSVDV
jgi:hypothetical protein